MILCIVAFLLAAPSRVPARTLVEQARAAAHADRNAEARDLFERALQEDPALRHELLRELADQRTYSGQAAAAVPLYREVLSWGESRDARKNLALALSWSGELDASREEYERVLAAAPDDADVRKNYARVLSWLDRNDEALAQYRQVLREHPDDAEALRNAGRVESWRGRQRSALGILAPAARAHPEDSEANRWLAQSEEWLGRPDDAERDLQGFLARRPEDRDARKQLSELDRSLRPAARVGAQDSRQSDGLEIRSFSMEPDVRPGAGRATVGPRYQGYAYLPSSGPAVRVDRPGLYARERLNDIFEVNAYGFLDLISSTGVQRAIPTWSAWASAFLSDSVRLDFGSGRETFDNVKSLDRGIAATSGSASIDFTPVQATRLAARANLAAYNDGNRRTTLQLEGGQRVLQHPQLVFGFRATAFEFARQLDNGYFNPHRMLSVSPTLHASGDLAKRAWWELDGSFGLEASDPDGVKPAWSASASVRYALTPALELEARGGGFSSRTMSSAGFARGWAGAGMRVTF